jgi:hypothetical protein
MEDGILRKTHARKGLRPVSQTGLHRIPHNPNQRVAGEGGRKVSGTALEAFNDSQEARWLHPTKGWRAINEKRTQAALTVAEILHHDPLPRSLTAGRSKYMPHIGKKQRAKAAAA